MTRAAAIFPGDRAAGENWIRTRESKRMESDFLCGRRARPRRIVWAALGAELGATVYAGAGNSAKLFALCTF